MCSYERVQYLTCYLYFLNNHREAHTHTHDRRNRMAECYFVPFIYHFRHCHFNSFQSQCFCVFFFISSLSPPLLSLLLYFSITTGTMSLLILKIVRLVAPHFKLRNMHKRKTTTYTLVGSLALSLSPSLCGFRYVCTDECMQNAGRSRQL